MSEHPTTSAQALRKAASAIEYDGLTRDWYDNYLDQHPTGSAMEIELSWAWGRSVAGFKEIRDEVALLIGGRMASLLHEARERIEARTASAVEEVRETLAHD